MSLAKVVKKLNIKKNVNFGFSDYKIHQKDNYSAAYFLPNRNTEKISTLPYNF